MTHLNTISRSIGQYNVFVITRNTRISLFDVLGNMLPDEVNTRRLGVGSHTGTPAGFKYRSSSLFSVTRISVNQPNLHNQNYMR